MSNNIKELKNEKPNGEEKKEADNLNHDLNNDLLLLLIGCYEIAKDKSFTARRLTNKKLTQYISSLNDEDKNQIIQLSKLLKSYTDKYKKIEDYINDVVMKGKQKYTTEICSLGKDLIMGIATAYVYFIHEEKEKLPNDKEFGKILASGYKWANSFEL